MFGAKRSNHLPEVAGAIETVTGLLIVETGLRNVQSFTVSLAQTPTATETVVAGILGEVLPGSDQKMTLKVMHADGTTPSASPAKVSWTAIGK